MDPIQALIDATASLEARVAFLENEAKRKDATIQSLLSTMEKPNNNLFPKIGELVNTKKTEAQEETEEDDEASATGLRTTELGVTEISSLCMNCHEMGETKLLLTSIPFFREVILTSFYCRHCHHRNVEIQSGGKVQEKGETITFKMIRLEDFNRQVIKSDSASLKVVELELEIPPSRGVVSNLEGIIREVEENLINSKQARLLQDPSGAEALDGFLKKMEKFIKGEMFPVTIVLDDPAGNSFIDNPTAPVPDAQLKHLFYSRTKEQDERLGFVEEEEEESQFKKEGAQMSSKETTTETMTMDNEIIQIPSNCPSCREEGLANTCIVDLPFFKEVIIMSFNCDNCGFKDTEIKGGGSIPTQGRRDILKVLDPIVDLGRDVIKGDSAGVKIPELEVELTRGSLGGMYTTVEGLVTRMMDDLFKLRIYEGEDSAENQSKKLRMDELQEKFELCLSGRMPFTLIIEDPLQNSYVYSPFVEEGKKDERLVVELYERTFEEDEELGLHDMNVDQKPQDDLNNDEEQKANEVMSKMHHDVHASTFTKGMED